MIQGHLILICVMLFAVLSERLFLQVDTGGRGLFPIMRFIVPAVVLALCILPSRGRVLQFLKSKNFWFFWGGFLTLMVVLPVFGVLLGSYPERSLLESLNGVLALSFITVGVWLASKGESHLKLAKSYLFLAIVGQFVYAFMQIAHHQGWLALDFFKVLSDWDLESQRSYSDSYILYGRSIGTFINPNELGFWAVISFWISIFFLNGGRRNLCVVASLGTLLLSESRGSMFALLGGLIFWLVLQKKLSMGKVAHPLVFPMVSLMGLFGLGFVLFGDFALEIPMLERFANGFLVLRDGAGADASFDGRNVAWQQALEFSESYPFGTLGSPEHLLNNFIDNEYIRIYVQGTFIYLGAFLLLIIGGFRSLTTKAPQAGLLALGTISIAINSISATPLSYPPIALFWVFVGLFFASLSSSSTQETSTNEEPGDSAPGVPASAFSSS